MNLKTFNDWRISQHDSLKRYTVTNGSLCNSCDSFNDLTCEATHLINRIVKGY